MTRKECLAQHPAAQAWDTLADDEKIRRITTAATGSQWQNLKTGKVVTLEKAERYGDVLYRHENGKYGTKQTHYFTYDYFPVEEISRDERIARDPEATKWFGIAAPDRAQLLAEENPGTSWKHLTTGTVVTFRDLRGGNSEGPVHTWRDGSVIVANTDGKAITIPETDFIYNYFPILTDQPDAQDNHPPKDAPVQPRLDQPGRSSPAAASPEETPVNPFRPKRLGRMTAYRLVENYMTKVRRRDLNEDISVCGLCANTGTLKLGERVGALGEPLPPCEVPCLCPNGQCTPWKTPGVPRGPL